VDDSEGQCHNGQNGICENLKQYFWNEFAKEQDYCRGNKGLYNQHQHFRILEILT